MLEMQQNSSIVIFGASGSIGRNLLSQLKKQHYTKLYYPTHAELDLTNQQQVESFFRKIRPEIPFLTAAKVGGKADAPESKNKWPFSSTSPPPHGTPRKKNSI